MDVCMPRMNGLDATLRIMETHPTPIVILSGNLDPEEVLTSFRAMEAGALVALQSCSDPSPASTARMRRGCSSPAWVRTARKSCCS